MWSGELADVRQSPLSVDLLEVHYGANFAASALALLSIFRLLQLAQLRFLQTTQIGRHMVIKCSKQ